ncbi:hypothetical protein COV82_00165 [Candidatus Peregrinibacteria bacterium CG11_big_fil_rev_8_21_14_0_20_46_8]|nr:MAG: hypothetical protein COV82_00165 [Candidatus Peregrinibacteria bacterium CG11_big_fil_rev_8_21_14_0_20_46_8]
MDIKPDTVIGYAYEEKEDHPSFRVTHPGRIYPLVIADTIDELTAQINARGIRDEIIWLTQAQINAEMGPSTIGREHVRPLTEKEKSQLAHAS